MRTLLAFLCALLFCQSASAQDQVSAKPLGKALVEAIADDDIVRYSQCWISTRRMIAMVHELGVEKFIPTNGLKEYHQRRNKSIAESFSQIQDLIVKQKIDRKSIKFKSCTPHKVGKKKAPKGESVQAQRLTVLFLAGGESWSLEIDDGVIDQDMWLFVDKPMHLTTENHKYTFVIQSLKP